jgi:hypothetical protein
MQPIETQVVERLLQICSQDSDLRHLVRRLAQSVLDATEDAPSEVVDDAVAVGVEDVAAHLEQPAVSQPAEETRSKPEIVPAMDHAPVADRQFGSAPPQYANDLQTIVARCRLKAEAARWAAQRRRLLLKGADFGTEIGPTDREFIARAKALGDCFLWMCRPNGPSPSNLDQYDLVAGCFEAVAEGVELVEQIQRHPGVGCSEFKVALDLLAESQSALRIAVESIGGSPDHDQNEVFFWLRSAATEYDYKISRFMRRDDPADPKTWPVLAARIKQAIDRVRDLQKRQSVRKRLLGKVRHKTDLILNEAEDAKDQWKLLVECVAELVGNGLPPSNVELRGLLLPVLDLLPDFDFVPVEFERVLREIDRYLASNPATDHESKMEVSPVLVEARKMMSGKVLLIIGGDKRPAAYEAIKSALGLRELLWIVTTQNESYYSFEHYVAREDVAVVALAIRWARHGYGEVQRFCTEYGKPLVRLPGGYSPNQVAAQIVAQASERLKR